MRSSCWSSDVCSSDLELNERVPRIPGFEIVLRSELVLPAGLTLPTGHRPQRIETSGERRNEALLGLHVGRDLSIARRLLLVGAVAAPEPLYRGIGLPVDHDPILDTLAWALSDKIGVQDPPGSAGSGNKK